MRAAIVAIAVLVELFAVGQGEFFRGGDGGVVARRQVRVMACVDIVSGGGFEAVDGEMVRGGVQQAAGALGGAGGTHLNPIVGVGNRAVDLCQDGAAAEGAQCGNRCILKVKTVDIEVVVLVLVAAEPDSHESATAAIVGETHEMLAPVVEIAGESVDWSETAPVAPSVDHTNLGHPFGVVV